MTLLTNSLGDFAPFGTKEWEAQRVAMWSVLHPMVIEEEPG